MPSAPWCPLPWCPGRGGRSRRRSRGRSRAPSLLAASAAHRVAAARSASTACENKKRCVKQLTARCPKRPLCVAPKTLCAKTQQDVTGCDPRNNHFGGFNQKVLLSSLGAAIPSETDATNQSASSRHTEVCFCEVFVNQSIHQQKRKTNQFCALEPTCCFHFVSYRLTKCKNQAVSLF